MSTIVDICKPGWANLPAIRSFLLERGVSWKYGPRESQTDGEANWVLTSKSGKEKSFSSNYWVGESWVEMLKWADTVRD
jgi:hypothetical protein